MTALADREENVLKATGVWTEVSGGCQQLTFDDLPDMNRRRAVATIAQHPDCRPGQDRRSRDGVLADRLDPR
jgi:hypothetical protein